MKLLIDIEHLFVTKYESILECLLITPSLHIVVWDLGTKHDQHVEAERKTDKGTSEAMAKPKETAEVPNKDLEITNRKPFEVTALRKMGYAWDCF